MKRKLFAAILWILVVCIALPALAEDVPPVIDVPSDPCASGHSWGEWRIIREATCATEGIQTHTCTVCGKEDQGVIPKTDNHAWGDWKITIEATCLASGLKSRTCSVCGRTENEGIPKNEHSWSGWEITKEPTCTESGNKKRICSRCGGTENKKIKALGHDAEEWTVTKEPTCQKTGEKEGTCIRCGKALTKKLNKVDHGFDEWEILEAATDFSKGKRESVCRFCKRKKTEEFYPAGTLAKELENDPDEMKALQTELKALGLYNREPNGKYDKATVEAINKAEKGLGLKQDGICWPGLRKLLLGPEGGVTADGDESIGPAPSKYKMQLSVKRVSSRKDYYEAGDEITYEWTLKNTSNAVCRKAKIYHYETDSKGNKKAETEIGNAGNLKPGESNTGLYIYTVTKEDEASGKIRHGLISRGNIGGKASSNPCLFMHFSLAGAGGKGGWTLPGTGILSVTVTADNEPENKFFFVKGETIRFRIEVRNKTTGDVDDIVVTDALFGDGWKETIGTLAGGESRTVDAEYTVTARDAIAGEVVSAAKVSCTQNREAGTAAGEARAKTGTNTYGLHVFNACTSVPKNGRFFVPGETVEFEIRVTNPTTDDTFRAPEIYDRLYSRVKAYKKEGQLKPGKTVTYTFKTKVTEYQGKTGKLTNYVLVRYKDPDRKPMVSRSNDCTVPCGIEGQESIVVTEKVVSTPDDGDFFTEGEEIRYRIEIANNTGRNITGAEIRNSLADMDSNGYRTLRSSETLRAGETCTVEFSYYVTGEDVANTKVTSRASVKWASGKDETTETCSETVTVATAPSVSSQTPGTRSLAGEACRPALTAIGEGTALRELTRCAAHAATAQEAERLAAEEAYANASLLWDAEISNLYLEWERSAGGEAGRIAENEQAAFTHQLAALEASLRLVRSEKEAQAIAAEERMEKCAELCFELHTAPADRYDSLNGTQDGLKKAKASVKCRREVSFTEGGIAVLDDRQCEYHMQLSELTRTQLEAAENDDDRETAWLQAQGNWLAELDTMYDTWYLSAKPAQRPLIAADRTAFDELVSARRESLASMYPGKPAAAAETLANMIMHRAELICRVLHEAGVLKK